MPHIFYRSNDFSFLYFCPSKLFCFPARLYYFIISTLLRLYQLGYFFKPFSIIIVAFRDFSMYYFIYHNSCCRKYCKFTMGWRETALRLRQPPLLSQLPMHATDLRFAFPQRLNRSYFPKRTIL